MRQSIKETMDQQTLNDETKLEFVAKKLSAITKRKYWLEHNINDPANVHDFNVLTVDPDIKMAYQVLTPTEQKQIFAMDNPTDCVKYIQEIIRKRA